MIIIGLLIINVCLSVVVYTQEERLKNHHEILKNAVNCFKDIQEVLKIHREGIKDLAEKIKEKE